MGKTFSPRMSKKDRKTVEIDEDLQEKLKANDDKLLQGAKLLEIQLKNIHVKDQVRTKFNDASIKDLAENIQANGLIQPLVVHHDGDHRYTLICGERRFRAMTSVDMESAPCFVLEGKTEQELMAIQFSENSAREALHYIDKADGILNYQKATKASERKIQQALGISKSEVHRSLMLAKMPKRIKEAAKQHNIEKYVLLEWDALEKGDLKSQVESKILSGELLKRSQLRSLLRGSVVSKGKKGSKKSNARRTRKKPVLPRGLTANAFLKAMNTKMKDMDPETRKLFNELVDDTRDIIDD